ncbi:hypothetical protein [Treponema socranskii]|uniref:hypothetical protein n=1 Tax=Treponema socranskii TaxID=53419 RepID=UPI0028EA76D9|nr:hypothetical protein [Treponema socranskii]
MLNFQKKTKIILIVQFFIAAAFLTAVCAFSRCIQNMDSDMASEIMLAKECFTHKTFWPRSWYYSTEFRLLNTQLIAAPLFAFTSSWITVKVVSAIILCFALPLSLWFLLGTLGVKTLWIKLLCTLFVFVPWSRVMWGMVQFGNYYIPHIAMSFVYIGFFLSLAYSKLSEKKRKTFCILFFALALISGAFITYIDILTSDGNLDKRAVCRFLDDNYDFGYATFWNANIFTMMTDGRLEFGNLYPDTIDGVDYIPEKFQCHLWLTPKRFYRDDYKSDEPIFFLVTQKEYADSPKRTVFKNGRQVYSDDFYRVFEFENKKAFIDGF